MTGVRDGQVERLALLYERHRSPLLNFFVRLTGDLQAAEDLVHDVFLRMLKYRHTFRDGHRFQTWMYQIARNAHFDFRHKRRLERPADEHALADAENTASADLAPDFAASRNQEIATLEKALASLPPQQRELLVFTGVQRLKYEEVARALDCGVGAVKMRVHRALIELREKFRELAGEEIP
jgi:RNA polymerase sigma-70 factor (ECF subfamily)